MEQPKHCTAPHGVFDCCDRACGICAHNDPHHQAQAPAEPVRCRLYGHDCYHLDALIAERDALKASNKLLADALASATQVVDDACHMLDFDEHTSMGRLRTQCRTALATVKEEP